MSRNTHTSTHTTPPPKKKATNTQKTTTSFYKLFMVSGVKLDFGSKESGGHLLVENIRENMVVIFIGGIEIAWYSQMR